MPSLSDAALAQETATSEELELGRGCEWAETRPWQSPVDAAKAIDGRGLHCLFEQFAEQRLARRLEALKRFAQEVQVAAQNERLARQL